MNLAFLWKDVLVFFFISCQMWSVLHQRLGQTRPSHPSDHRSFFFFIHFLWKCVCLCRLNIHPACPFIPTWSHLPSHAVALVVAPPSPSVSQWRAALSLAVWPTSGPHRVPDSRGVQGLLDKSGLRCGEREAGRSCRPSGSPSRRAGSQSTVTPVCLNKVYVQTLSVQEKSENKWNIFFTDWLKSCFYGHKWPQFF